MDGGNDTVDTSPRDAPSQSVVRAVAQREDVDPVELSPPEYEPLHDVVDPTALDALFAPRPEGTPRRGGRVEFTFCGYDVTVESDGTISID